MQENDRLCFRIFNTNYDYRILNRKTTGGSSLFLNTPNVEDAGGVTSLNSNKQSATLVNVEHKVTPEEKVSRNTLRLAERVHRKVHEKNGDPIAVLAKNFRRDTAKEVITKHLFTILINAGSLPKNQPRSTLWFHDVEAGSEISNEEVFEQFAENPDFARHLLEDIKMEDFQKAITKMDSIFYASDFEDFLRSSHPMAFKLGYHVAKLLPKLKDRSSFDQVPETEPDMCPLMSLGKADPEKLYSLVMAAWEKEPETVERSLGYEVGQVKSAMSGIPSRSTYHSKDSTSIARYDLHLNPVLVSQPSDCSRCASRPFFSLLHACGRQLDNFGIHNGHPSALTYSNVIVWKSGSENASHCERLQQERARDKSPRGNGAWRSHFDFPS